MVRFLRMKSWAQALRRERKRLSRVAGEDCLLRLGRWRCIQRRMLWDDPEDLTTTRANPSMLFFRGHALGAFRGAQGPSLLCCPSPRGPDLACPSLRWAFRRLGSGWWGGEGSHQGARGENRACSQQGGKSPLPRERETTGRPEARTYQACKLDPGVNGLRLSVPHSVHQPDRGPAGPRRRSLPAGVRLQQMGVGRRVLEAEHSGLVRADSGRLSGQRGRAHAGAQEGRAEGARSQANVAHTGAE